MSRERQYIRNRAEVRSGSSGARQSDGSFLSRCSGGCFVVEEPDALNDLFAAQSSLGFWDNPYDDEDWNKTSS